MPDDEQDSKDIDQQPEVEEPLDTNDASENIPGELQVNTQGKTAVMEGSKKDIMTLLKKNPTVSIGIVVVIMIMLLLLAMLIFDSSGGDDYQYKEGACKTVTVIYKPYDESKSSSSQTMDIETYVKSATYEYMKNIKTPDTGIIHVYYALSIALRTEAVVNNCQVTYRDKKLTQNVESNSYLDTVMESAKGLVLTDINGDYIDVKIADFCWFNVNNTDINYLVYQGNNMPISRDFAVEAMLNDIYRDCPCNNPQGDPFPDEEDEDEDEEDEYSKCWVTWDSDDDGEDDEASWLHYDDTTGLSVMGAYYLMAEYNYSYKAILEYFFNSNITFMTIDEQSTKNKLPNYSCVSGEFPYTATSLSKTEFIALVEEFFLSGNYASWTENFVTYAGDIWEMGREKGINPEILYIIARKETSFTKVNTNTQHYNYYGMGHSNEKGHGTFYDSFMEGVEAQFDYYVKRGSFENLVGSYSSLGNWLYNFDSEKEQGLGGCYYMRVIYGENYSRCNSSYYCAAFYDSSGNVTGRSDTCVRTTEEEKEAYIDWQVEQYWEHRQAIFKISSSMCVNIDTGANTYIPSEVLTQSLSSYLLENGSSIDELNQTILNNVMSAGVGTRKGVAVAATTLINFMNQFDIRIPYTYGGGHSSVKGVGRSVDAYYGVDPDWGTPIGNYYYSNGYGPYTHYGPDCSAFVVWVLKNGGIKISTVGSQNFKTLPGVTVYNMNDTNRAQIGDVLVSSGHVVIVVGVDEENQQYIVAESNGLGKSYRPYTKGISYTTINFVSNVYVIVDMSAYYNDANKRYTSSEFNEIYNAGLL